MKTFIYLVRNNWLKEIDCGWGNGYVAIPEDNRYYGVHYDNLSNVAIHGGLTFSEQIGKYWVIGFDTAHYLDNSTEHNIEYVLTETLRLQEQVDNNTIIINLI